MSPCPLKNECRNLRLADPKFRRQRFLSKAFGGIELPDFSDLCLRHKSTRMRLSTHSIHTILLSWARLLAALGYAALSVIQRCSYKQMGRITARRIVAFVTHKKIPNNMTKCQFVRDTMGKSGFSISPHSSIASLAFIPNPRPTFRWFTHSHSRPKHGCEEYLQFVPSFYKSCKPWFRCIHRWYRYHNGSAQSSIIT